MNVGWPPGTHSTKKPTPGRSIFQSSSTMVTTRQGSDDSAAAADLAVPSSLELVSWLAEEAELAAKLRAVRLRIQQAKDAGVEVPCNYRYRCISTTEVPLPQEKFY